MAEYIERDKAFKLIKEQKEKETGAYSKGRNKGLIIAGSIINNKEVLPTADVVPGWIDVRDRLPEDHEDVLCWYEYFRYGSYNRMYQTYGIGYCVNGNWGGEVSNGTKCRVIAWQPLPDPPTERRIDNVL